MRISRILGGGLVGAFATVALSGCAGAPALDVQGDLVPVCFSTATSDDGFMAIVAVTLQNTSERELILREAEPVRLDNARVHDMAAVRLATAYDRFGVAPGGMLSPPQRPLYNDRVPVEGLHVHAGESVELLLELHARDYRDYAGVEGVRVKYDDGWFSATATSDTEVGFVPPWTTCSAHGR